MMTGAECWLSRPGMADGTHIARLRDLRTFFAARSGGPVMRSAVEELARGLQEMAGAAPVRVRSAARASVVMGTVSDLSAAGIGRAQEMDDRLGAEGFVLEASRPGGAWPPEAARSGTARLPETGPTASPRILCMGRTPAGVLRAVFRLMEALRLCEPLDGIAIMENPANPLRVIDHWDNLDGKVERGYAGSSIFFEGGRVVKDLSRVRAYARLLASIGINAVVVNNVNVHAAEARLITPHLLPDVERLAAVFRAWGIRLFLSVDFSAPMTLGKLGTADPLDPAVRRWWKECASRVYARIPDFGGFLVKADSEGRPGPFAYGRDHAEGANALAEALAPHGGILFWRAFVYNCRQDWRDRSTDRARAAYDSFMPLDGKFLDNVVVQIKNGPMDFQVREPVSPLFGGMEKTNQVLELQITQEYTGQQRHLCFLAPQWTEYLGFDTHAGDAGGLGAAVGKPAALSAVGQVEGPAGRPTTLARIASGAAGNRALGGIAGVSNVGSDPNWTGHDLAQANLYAFGRLAWDPDLPAADIAARWIGLTFGTDAEVQRVLTGMLMDSWGIYESYTAPLGVGWMVTPHTHYGPAVDGYEYDRWGTYHFADCRGIGVDRSAATGTGYAAQYRKSNAALYESADTCPEELLLFFHHVPYTRRLSSGKTVIQHIYDTHFEGAERAAGLVERWTRLRGKVDEARWAAVRDRLQEQVKSAEEWRDVINTYFLRKSGIPDGKGRRIY